MLRLHRLNCLGSLHYFIKVALQRTRLTAGFHLRICRKLESESLKLLLEIPRDHYKALDINTPIPTPDGFRRMGDIQVNDEVFAVNGAPTKVTAVSPIMVGSKCYRVVFSTGEELIADAGHLWYVDVRRLRANLGPNRSIVIDTTEHLARSVIYKNKLDVKSGKYYPEYNYRVLVTDPVQCKPRKLIIHPYALGAWLGDGSTDGAVLTSETNEIPELCRKFGESINKQNTHQRYGFVNNFIVRLRILGVLGNKRIPEEYAWAAKEQRLLLLQGLMDTDGSINKEGQCSFTNTNKRLIGQVRDLLASLGYMPSPIANYEAILDGGCCGRYYVITFYASPPTSPFLLPRKKARLRELKNTYTRKIVAIEPCDSVPVKCIAVEHHAKLYLAGDGFIPTHNSTMASEGLPMWRTLPISQRDIDEFSALGYDKEFLRHMAVMHDCTMRNMLVSENISNSAKLGSKIRRHYESGAIYRTLFPETLPTSQERWTDFSLQVRQPAGCAPHGEGTFDFIGVGGATQSRHYNGLIIEDDLVGKKAVESPSVMEKTIEYHKLLPTLFDAPDAAHEGNQLVIGNRWDFHDLNSYIREHETWFDIESHSALGGCCPDHPMDTPIFPEVFSLEKLEHRRHQLGSYLFS